MGRPHLFASPCAARSAPVAPSRAGGGGKRLVLLTAFLLAGCAQFPELDSAISAEARAAPAPRIVPLEPLLAGLGDGRAEGVREATLARAEALRAEGAALGAEGADAAERDRTAERRRRLAAERATLAE